MTHQEDGWPLGLRRLNGRGVGLVRNNDDFSGSLSFNTLLTASPTSSSDFDAQSTGSFFHDNNISLGSLIGVSRILELSRTSTRGRRTENIMKEKQQYKPKPWLFSICCKLSTDAVTMKSNAHSLQHYLEAERTANIYRRNHSRITYGPDELSLPVTHHRALFVRRHTVPPDHSSTWMTFDGERSNGYHFEHDNGDQTPLPS